MRVKDGLSSVKDERRLHYMLNRFAKTSSLIPGCTRLGNQSTYVTVLHKLASQRSELLQRPAAFNIDNQSDRVVVAVSVEFHCNKVH